MTVLIYDGREVAIVFSGKTYLFQYKIKDLVIGYKNDRGYINAIKIKCSFIFETNVQQCNNSNINQELNILIKNSWVVYPETAGVFFGYGSYTDFYSFTKLAKKMGFLWNENVITDPLTLKVVRVKMDNYRVLTLNSEEIAYISRHLPDPTIYIYQYDEIDGGDCDKIRHFDDVDDADLM
jgi:hypothetical protein